MSTQPTEAQYALACRIWCCKNSGDGAQLIADSEARVVEAEREKVRVLREACKKDADVYRTLERELAEATAEASHYMAVAQKATDELIFFRADSLKAHQMACAAALERDRLRAEVERLKAPRSLFVSAGIYEDALARAEKAEAERDALAKELGNIANAKPATWGDMSDSFQAWAQNRARHALAAMKGTI